jgi:acyl-CoA synthetase (AMP-forming)/AMP-acid ligase II
MTRRRPTDASGDRHVELVDKQGRVGTIRPFDERGVVRRADNVLDYVGRPESLVEMFATSVDRYGGRAAIKEVGGRTLTYRELFDAAASVAGGLRSLGVVRGDRVGLRLPNSATWVVAYLGIQLAGAIAVPINTRLTPAEVEFIVGDSGAKLVIGPEDPLPSGAPHVVTSTTRHDLAAILYTSGTTGFPKGAMTTHNNLLSVTETIRRLSSLDPNEGLSTLVSVPLFHVTGCNAQLLPTLEVGGTVVILGAFDVRRFLHAIVDERATMIVAVPSIYAMALAQPDFATFDLGHVTRVSYGGAPMPPALIGELRAALPGARLSNGFGLTESASIVTRLPDAWCGSRPDSVGFATPVVELDLADVDATGAGELLVRSPGVVAGYWGRPELSAEVFADGWLHTGDVATIDDDGFCVIVDRRKDVIMRGGENVYSVEVENVLAAHPAVLEVAVVGVPDEVMGERVGAAIVTVPGATIGPDDVLAFAAGRLAKYKLPEHVLVRREPLPRNAGGKVVKPTLRDTFDWGSPKRFDG